jgi:hypothetical protein
MAWRVVYHASSRGEAQGPSMRGGRPRLRAGVIARHPSVVGVIGYLLLAVALLAHTWFGSSLRGRLVGGGEDLSASCGSWHGFRMLLLTATHRSSRPF